MRSACTCRGASASAWRLDELGLRDFDDTIGAACVTARAAASGTRNNQAIRERIGRVTCNDCPGREGARIGIGIFRDHADNSRREPERVAHSDHPANAGAEADRDIDSVVSRSLTAAKNSYA
jgi:hypothetical protein